MDNSFYGKQKHIPFLYNPLLDIQILQNMYSWKSRYQKCSIFERCFGIKLSFSFLYRRFECSVFKLYAYRCCRNHAICLSEFLNRNINLRKIQHVKSMILLQLIILFKLTVISVIFCTQLTSSSPENSQSYYMFHRLLSSAQSVFSIFILERRFVVLFQRPAFAL